MCSPWGGINARILGRSLDDLIRRYLLHKEANQARAHATLEKYRLCLERLRAYLSELGTTLTEASTDQLREFVGIHLHVKGLSPRARRPMISCVRDFYAWLSASRVVKSNLAATLEQPRVGRKLPHGIQLSDLERLLQAPDIETFIGLRDLAIMMVLGGTGIRVSGLVAMNESSLIWMREGERERLVIRVKEKGGNERLVPAPDEVRLIVRAYLGHPELREIDRSLPDGDAVLWVSTRNRLVSEADYYGEARRLAARAVNKLLERYGDRAGVPRATCHPHALRHLYGTELAEDDTSTLAIQALLGHADPKTSEIYTRAATRKLSRIVDQSNPLRKIRTPVSELARRLRAAP